MNGNRLCGMDSSTKKTAISLFSNGEYEDFVLIDHSDIKDIEDRTKEMGKSIISQLNLWRPDMVYIEQPKGKPNVELVRKLSRILGIVMGWAIANDCYYEEVMPSVWRKYVPEFDQGGKDRDELKEESIRVCKEVFGVDAPTDDVSDAINLAYGMINRYTDDELF